MHTKSKKAKVKEDDSVLAGWEKETVISFNEAEDLAFIFTYNKVWQRHLEDKLGLKPIVDNSSGGKEYAIDKMKIRPPRAPRKLPGKAKIRRTKRLTNPQ